MTDYEIRTLLDKLEEGAVTVELDLGSDHVAADIREAAALIRELAKLT